VACRSKPESLVDSDGGSAMALGAEVLAWFHGDGLFVPESFLQWLTVRVCRLKPE
jgi:hypothetical protein